MRILVISLITLISFWQGCKKELALPSGTPPCIRDEISANHKNKNWETGNVKEYEFQNQLVYAFTPDERIIADASTVIKDANCNVLCHVGGFGGPSINLCNGENFFQVAVLKRTIWTKH